MTGGMLVMVPSELEAGFRLAGVDVVGIATGEEAVTALHELVESGEKDLVAVYQPFMSAMSERDRTSFESSLSPVILSLPAGLQAHDVESHRARISAMLSRAVGYHITFGEEGGS